MITYSKSWNGRYLNCHALGLTLMRTRGRAWFLCGNNWVLAWAGPFKVPNFTRGKVTVPGVRS